MLSKRLAVFGAAFLLLSLLLVPARAAPKPDIQKLIPGFDAYAQKTFERSQVPGMALAVVAGGKVVYLKCFGVTKAGGKQAITPDTVFQLASCSKAFGSASVAALVGEGKVSFDDPVSRYLPEFRLADPWVSAQITLRDCLSHRSGLPAFAGEQLEGQFKYGQDEIFKRLRHLKFAAGFRAAYAYQNHVYSAGAVAAARAVGLSWPELAAQKIFKPLGMKQSSAYYRDYAQAAKRTTPHVWCGGKWTPHSLRSAQAQAPAGGVSSTIEDMGKWLRMQLGLGKFAGKQVIVAKALAQTQQPQIISHASGVKLDCYAMGWVAKYGYGIRQVTHQGAFEAGVNTLVGMFPEYDTGLVVLTNTMMCGLTGSLELKLGELLSTGQSKIDFWPARHKMIMQAVAQMGAPAAVLPPAPAKPIAARPLGVYAGEYMNDYFGLVRVVPAGKSLKLYTGKNPEAMPLSHFSGDIFAALVDGYKVPVVFTLGPGGRASQVYLSLLDFGGRDANFVRRGPKP